MQNRQFIFTPQNPIQISRRAKRGEPFKLAISYVVELYNSARTFFDKNWMVAALRAAQTIPCARAGKKEGGWGEGIFARPRFPPPPNVVLTKLAHRFLI